MIQTVQNVVEVESKIIERSMEAGASFLFGMYLKRPNIRNELLSACENSMKALDQYFDDIDEAFALQRQNSSQSMVEIWRKTTDWQKMFYFLEFHPFLLIIGVILEMIFYTLGEYIYCGLFVYAPLIYIIFTVDLDFFPVLIIVIIWLVVFVFRSVGTYSIIALFAYIIFMAEAMILGLDQKVFLRPFFSDEYPTSLLYNRSGTRRKFIRTVLPYVVIYAPLFFSIVEIFDWLFPIYFHIPPWGIFQNYKIR